MAGITCQPITHQCVCLRVITDVCSRKSVGWHVHDTLQTVQTEGVSEALGRAVTAA
jgi:hypothetical protein